MFHSYNFKNFGSMLRDIRKNAGLTQSNVKELTGINEDSLRRIEKGSVIPKYETLEILSTVYKFDLLNVLLEHRSHPSITEIYMSLDKIINSNDLGELNQLKESIHKAIDAHQQYEIFDSNELQLILDFTEFIDRFYHEERKEHQPLYEEVKAYFFKHVNIDSFDQLDENQYSFLELRYLILIALLGANIRILEESNKLLKYSLDYLKQPYFHTKEVDDVRVKLYFNMSYNYHIMDEFEEALAYANIGIHLANSIHSSYCLAHLYMRKGIALLFLKRDGAKEAMQFAVTIADATDDSKLAHLFRDISKKKYDITLT